jgi:ABC-type glycerol-3-phosphate transport system permease component
VELARHANPTGYQLADTLTAYLTARVGAGVGGLFTFPATWNGYLGPLIYLNSPEKYTLSLGLAQFRREHGVQWGALMAVSMVMLIPVE